MHWNIVALSLSEILMLFFFPAYEWSICCPLEKQECVFFSCSRNYIKQVVEKKVSIQKGKLGATNSVRAAYF